MKAISTRDVASRIASIVRRTSDVAVSGAGVRLLLPSLIIAGLTLSSLFAVRGALRMRSLEERTVRDLASLAAYNFGGRVVSMLGNFAPAITGAAGKRGVRTASEDLEQVVTALDSLRSCCESILPATGVATGAWGDTNSIVLHSRSQQDRSRVALLREIARWPVSTRPARFATGGTKASPFFFVVYPQYNVDRKSAGFVAVELDLAIAADSTFAPLFRQRPLLLPDHVTGLSDNARLGNMVMSDPAGHDLFRSKGVGTSSPYHATVSVGDTTLQFTMSLSSEAVSGILRGTTPGASAQLQIIMALTTILLSLTVAFALYRAQSLARLRTNFAAAVTHELRTPLSQILLNSETLQLQRARSDDERQTLIDGIVGESRRLVHLIDNVLHFSKAERRVFNVDLLPRRVDELVASVVNAREGIDFIPGDPITIPIDAGAFVLALANVLDNAVLHGAPPVKVSITPFADEVHVIVQDSGAGIPRSQLRRVLQPFVRLADARRRHPTGAGIGLAVAAEVMNAMHGNVTLEESNLGGVLVRLILRR